MEPHEPRGVQTDPVDAGGRKNRSLATSHYENFAVGSILLPREPRQDLFNIYAFCRLADDIADEETGGVIFRLAQLDEWERRLEECVTGKTNRQSSPTASSADELFASLAGTIERHNLPLQPFKDLLRAFRLDLTKTRYETWDDLLDYAKFSANPVGRLVLGVFGSSDESFFAYSDKICTALQLANHWQDVASDYRRGRIYIPQELLREFSVSEDVIFRSEATPAFTALMKELVMRATSLFEEGKPLLKIVPPSLRPQLYLYWGGGMAALKAITAAGYDVLTHRCRVGTGDRWRLMGGALARWASSRIGIQ